MYLRMSPYIKILVILFLCYCMYIVLYIGKPVRLEINDTSNWQSRRSETHISNISRKQSIRKSIPDISHDAYIDNKKINLLKLFTNNGRHTKSVESAYSKNKKLVIDERIKITWENIPHWLPGNFYDNTTFTECEIKSCVIHTQIQTADAVIFYMVGYNKHEPPQRPQGQIWIIYGWESPYHIFSSVWSRKSWEQQINWTMTYRMDSTIPIPYGQVFTRYSDPTNLETIVSKKSKLIAWVVSNCSFDPAKRASYVDVLQKHLQSQIDIYGSCGSIKAGDDVFDTIDANYKFYLAFENSLCTDYITEKFFERQNLNLILIVRGDGNYSRFYPRDSYIDTRDFKSIKELATYIEYLDKNNTAYTQYLTNKIQFKSKDRFYVMQQGLCEICKRLHENEKTVPYSYANIGSWWHDNICKTPLDII